MLIKKFLIIAVILADILFTCGCGGGDGGNSTANVGWTKTFGGVGINLGYSVQQTSDGGYIIVGQTNSFGAGNYDVYLIKTDVQGNLLWEKTFGGTGNEIGYAVQQTSDGGFIIAGSTSLYSVGYYSYPDVYLIKTDSGGNIQWEKTIGGTGNDGGSAVQQTSDGGFIIAGSTSSFGLGLMNVYLIKTD